MDYIPVLILMALGLFVGLTILILSALLGPKLTNRKKNQPFECGVPPLGSAQHRVSVKFYLVALLFLLFDVEAVFFFPWAIVFKEYLKVSSFILYEMGFFTAVLLLGYFYILRRGALDWD